MPQTHAPEGRVSASAASRDEAEAAIVGDEARTATILVVALVAALPLALGRPVWSTVGGDADWNLSVVLAPFDVVLVVVAGWAVLHRSLLVGLFRSRLSRTAAATFAVGFALSLALHPSPLGVALGWRLGTGLAVVAVTGAALSEPAARRRVLAAIAAVGVVQALLAAVQSARGRAFGVAPIDWEGALYPFGDSFAGRGGLTHPYHLAVLLVVAQGAALLGLRHAVDRRPWLAALAIIGLGLGVTYTRAGLLGQLALVAVALVAGRAGPTRLAAVAIAGGLLVGGVAFGDGWVAKAEASQGDDVTSSRTERLSEAMDLVESEPVAGVGPGRYVAAQEAYDRDELLPAHNLVFHEAAELGPIGLLGVLLLLAALTRRAVRGGVWAVMVAVPMAPFLALDAFPYVFPIGLAASAVWLALIRHAGEPTGVAA